MTRPLAPPSASERVAEGLRATLEPVLGTAGRPAGRPVAIDGLRRLSGGASRETWSFSVDGRDLILRRDPPGRPGARGSMRLEADSMRACHRAGLLVPEVLVDDDGDLLGTAGLVMGSVPGETLARKILRDDDYASARAVLVEELASFLAGLHALDPAEVPGLAEVDSMAQYWASYELVDDVSPTFEKAYAWLMANQPARTATTIVHGDHRDDQPFSGR